jgi:hypothetical protein
MTSGYSNRSLTLKLGLKRGFYATFPNSPAYYHSLLGDIPEGVIETSLGQQNCDFIHFFTTSAEELKTELPHLKAALKTHGMLWISWPKQTSGITTTISENDVRTLGLAAGLVDVKVIAVDETWSGLKFVYRLTDR